MRHELWVHPEEGHLLCVAGPRGDGARALLAEGAELVWTVEASSHFEVMTLFYERMGWGEYTTSYPEHDKTTYAELGWE